MGRYQSSRKKCHPCGPKVSADSEVGGKLRSCVVKVGVEVGAAYGGQHYVRVAGELGHLAASTLRLPTVKSGRVNFISTNSFPH